MKVVSVIPAGSGVASMIFARRLDDALKSCGVNVLTYSLDTTLRGYCSGLRGLHAVVRAHAPDVLIAHFGSLAGATVAFAAPGKSVVIFRGSDLNPWKGPFLHVRTSHLLSRVAALRADYVICVSAELRRKISWRRRRIEVLPSGVDDAIFRPTDFAEARRSLGWRIDEKVILFNGARRAVKRLDLAQAGVAAAQELLGRPIRLEILGGDTEPRRIPQIMSAANCLLVVSDYEGSPTVVQEAMACGLPVVSVRAGDVEEMLAGVHPSWIVERNPQMIGRAMVECLGAPEPPRSNGRQFLSRCSLNAVAERLAAIMSTLSHVASSEAAANRATPVGL